jgi:hypothetical protein
LDSTRLSRKLTSLLNAAQIREVHHVALGFEDSFLLTWRDTNGRDHIGSVLPASSQTTALIVSFRLPQSPHGAHQLPLRHKSPRPPRPQNPRHPSNSRPPQRLLLRPRLRLLHPSAHQRRHLDRPAAPRRARRRRKLPPPHGKARRGLGPAVLRGAFAAGGGLAHTSAGDRGGAERSAASVSVPVLCSADGGRDDGQ